METPDRFRLLFNCKIKDTGHTLKHIPNMAMKAYQLHYENLSDLPIKTEKIISIELPESEYERFKKHWDQYMMIMDVGKDNEHVRTLWHQLCVLANLYN